MTLVLFNEPAPKGKTDTSEEAALKLYPELTELRWATLLAIFEKSRSTNQISTATGIPYSTAQPRTSELKDLELIRDSGKRYVNKYGNKEIVWEVTKAGRILGELKCRPKNI